MVESKKLVGYFISSKKRCVKAYVKYNPKTKKYSKTRFNHKSEPLEKGIRVYKTKTKCKEAVEKMLKKVKGTKGAKGTKKYNKFGETKNLGESDICYNSAPYFGNLVPVISPYMSGTKGTGYTSVSAHWPNGLAKAIQDQSYVYKKM